jgi:glucosamine-6-phosphate deaminase
MQLRVFEDAASLSRTAAAAAAARLRAIVARHQPARLVAATGTSQIAFLEYLCQEPGVAWAQVELFHLDEYIGLPADHPASFRRFLRTRLVEPTGIPRVHWLDGDGDVAETICRVGAALAAGPLDLAFAGIGENAHLAFNDPPADFDTDAPLLDVALDEASRRQQVGEGWFAAVADVPTRAITMSIAQIMKVETILCLVSGSRKREAVARTFGDGPVDPRVPASILRRHPRAVVYVDRDAAAGLTAVQLARWR